MRALATGAWVVTGAASGFGREFAVRLARKGAALALFDRDADGIIDQRDLKVVAKLTTGETPPDDALQAYIRRGDLDGDLALNETEYLLLLAAERASGKGFLEWPSQPQGEDKELNKEGK